MHAPSMLLLLPTSLQFLVLKLALQLLGLSDLAYSLVEVVLVDGVSVVFDGEQTTV